MFEVENANIDDLIEIADEQYGTAFSKVLGDKTNISIEFQILYIFLTTEAYIEQRIYTIDTLSIVSG
jgi:hypothetical protein